MASTRKSSLLSKAVLGTALATMAGCNFHPQAASKVAQIGSIDVQPTPVSTPTPSATPSQVSPTPTVAPSPPNTSTGNLIYQENFELNQWFPLSGTELNKTHNIENCNDNSTQSPATYDWTLSRVADQAFRQAKAARFEVKKGQPLVGSAQRVRSEVTIIKGDDPRFTAEIWYAFAMMIPSNGGESDNVRCAINQWFEDGSDETTIRTHRGRAFLELGTQNYKQFDLFSSQTAENDSSQLSNHPLNEWHEFVFHFKHSMGADGLIEVWRDGEKIHTIPGPNIHSKLPKWKIGLYESGMANSNVDHKVIYFDNIRIGKANATLQDMSDIAQGK